MDFLLAESEDWFSLYSSDVWQWRTTHFVFLSWLFTLQTLELSADPFGKAVPRLLELSSVAKKCQHYHGEKTLRSVFHTSSRIVLSPNWPSPITSMALGLDILNINRPWSIDHVLRLLPKRIHCICFYDIAITVCRFRTSFALTYLLVHT